MATAGAGGVSSCFTHPGLVLLCAQGCSFPPKLLPHLSDPGSLWADIPDLLQGCLLMLLRSLLSPEPCQSSSPPFPLPPALPRRAGTPQASPLIVFSLWQVERDETPTPCLRWLPNYFCVFSMSNYLRRDHSGDISPQESHLCPRRTGRQLQGAEKMPGIAGVDDGQELLLLRAGHWPLLGLNLISPEISAVNDN